MAQTSFELDEGTAKAIEDLKKEFGVKTSAGVIRKAIALARIAVEEKNKADNTITLASSEPGRHPVKVSLTG